MSQIEVSASAVTRDDGRTVECTVRCRGKRAVVIFREDDVIVDIPEHSTRDVSGE